MRARSIVESALLALGGSLELGACIGVSACGPDCNRPPILTYAVRIDIEDASSGDAICDAAVTLTVDGSTVALAQACAYAGGTRPGHYEISVTRTGYETTTVDVSVPKDECSEPVQQHIKIQLERVKTP